MKKIYITRRIPTSGLKMLDKYDLEIYDGEAPPPKKEILRGTKDKDALICLLTDEIDTEIMDASSRLQIIANYAAGVDNINLSEATKRGIFVCNTPGVLTETTADFTWALITAVARRIVEGDRLMKKLQFKGWAPQLMLGTDIHGKTLGIIGMGKIGTAVAQRAAGFGMTILYYNRTRKHDVEKTIGAKFVCLANLLRQSDFITLHLPLTQETRYLIGKKEFKMMKKSAFFINTARGKCMDETALVEALTSGEIQGAALDVFEHEPEITQGLLTLPNVVLAPHMGSASHGTRDRMAEIAAENVLAAFNGRIPPNCLNPDVEKKTLSR
jgi:glyoxylate reductase